MVKFRKADYVKKKQRYGKPLFHRHTQNNNPNDVQEMEVCLS